MTLLCYFLSWKWNYVPTSCLLRLTGTPHLATSEQQSECCKETHKSFKSGYFKKLSVRERAERTKVRKRCYCCLRPRHRSEAFNGSKCEQWARKHHTLLHRENILSKNTNQQPTSGTTSTQANDKKKNKAKATTEIAKSKNKNTFIGAMTQRISEGVFLQTAHVSVNCSWRDNSSEGTSWLSFTKQPYNRSAVQRYQLKKKSTHTKVLD